jgi:predicted MFS family arabinose efflux permease
MSIPEAAACPEGRLRRAIVRPMTPSTAAPRNPWSIFVTVALGTFMSTLDSSIVNVALPTLQHDFAATVTEMGWVALAYPATLTLLLLPFGRLGDAIGRRRVYLGGLALFVAGSALCALAEAAWPLIGARIVQGVGASMIAANAAAIVTAAFPAAMRGRALGSIGAVVGLGLTVGPPVGGILLAAFGWPSIFLVNLPVGALTLLMGLRLLPRDARLPDPAADPLFDARLLRAPVFVAAIVALFASFVALFAVVFLAPFYLQNVAGLTPDKVGQVLVVAPVLLFAVAPLALAGLGLMTAGLLLLAWRLGAATTRPAGVGEMIAGLFVLGLGQGVFQPPNSSAAMGSVPPARLGLAGGMIATTRNFGMLVGMALAATTYDSREAVYRAAGAGTIAAAGMGMRDALVLGALVAAAGFLFVALTRGSGQGPDESVPAP